jgi:predicted secreted protein
MRRTLAGIAASLLMLSCAGCSDDGVIRIDSGDAGDVVELGLDEVLEVRLRASPTAGFEWTVLDAGILELVSERYEPDSDLDGSPGTTTLTFSPAGPGSGALQLVYLQPFREDPEPVETFAVTVTVTE